MAQPSFEAFLWSLTQQESGGNYGAIGPKTRYGHAYGKYQVLEGNIGPWTARYYGKQLTPQQFLNNPKAQEAVARGVLQSYYNQYGARGAASKWYSGNASLDMSTAPQSGGPSIKDYVDSVINRAGGYSGQSTSTSSSSGGGAVVPQLSDDELAASYGLSRALINSSKELKSLFRKAVSGGWSAGRFQASLKNTKWWKTQPTTLRQYLTQKYEDPATFTQKREAAGAAMKVLAVQAGIGADDLLKNGKWTSLLSDLVYKSVALGWTDARIKNYVGAKAALHGDVMYGEAGEAFDKLHALAYANGVTQSSTWYRDTARSIVSGHSTLEGQEANIRRLAAAKFSTFAEQIKAGQNAMDLAAPYINAVSQILEMPESDVDLNNKWVYGAMTGNESGSNYPLWKFENDVRSDPLWKKTNNARESMFGVAHQVAKDFGLVF